jgi:DNA-binding HxlR family transcriptional regulator
MKTECIGTHIKLRGKTYPCTVSLTMNLIGGKWKAVILYHLKDQEKRYSELRKEMPAITEMTLSLQLKQMEQDQLLHRQVYGRKPPVKVVYSLTEFGKSLLPVLEAITDWGNRTAEQEGEFVLVDDTDDIKTVGY